MFFSECSGERSDLVSEYIGKVIVMCEKRDYLLYEISRYCFEECCSNE